MTSMLETRRWGAFPAVAVGGPCPSGMAVRVCVRCRRSLWEGAGSTEALKKYLVSRLAVDPEEAQMRKQVYIGMARRHGLKHLGMADSMPGSMGHRPWAGQNRPRRLFVRP